MHAAALAERLGIDRVVVPPASGVRSAVGLLGADESHDALRTVRTPLDGADIDRVESVYADLRDRVLSESADPEAATVARTAACRYAGQAFELTVDAPDPFDPETVRTRFEAAHDEERGYTLEDEPVEVVDLGATATTPGTPPAISHDPAGDPHVGNRPAVFDGEAVETPVYDPAKVALDRTVTGPAVFEGAESTTVLPPGWTASPDDRGALVLSREGESRETESHGETRGDNA
jgi:N-methylhydantoinase A